MDIDELNRKLMELTESETAYQTGAVSGWNVGGNPATDENGRVRLSSTWLFASRSWGTDVGRGRHPIAMDRQFFMRKHSRFNATPEHVHDYVEISYVYRGSCRQVIDGNPLLLRENQVLLLDSDCPHSIDALEEQDILISVCVNRELLSRCLIEARDVEDWLTDFLYNALDEQADHNRYVLFHSERDRRIRTFFQELMCEYFDPSSNADRIIYSLFLLTLSELMNVYEDDYVRREREETGSKVSVVSIVRHIQENYLTCTLESVAERFFVTPNYVSRLLKQSTGKTYMQLVQDQRLQHAAGLLRSGTCSVEEAARAVGYENMSFFYRKFKANYGVTPAAYRKG